jgi:transposase
MSECSLFCQLGGEKEKMSTRYYVGVDIGKKKCNVAMMNQSGLIDDEFAFSNNHEGIEWFSKKLSMDDRVVMESTGSFWTNLYNHLDSKHIPVILANPLKTKAIAWARIKSDEVDARILAHLLRSDLIAESYVPPYNLREIRALIRHRLSIVKIRTMVKNKIHSLIDKNGIETELENNIFSKRGIDWLKSLQFQSSLDRLMLDNYLEHLESLQHQIKTVDQEILLKASEDEDVRLLLSLTGVSIYTALLLKSEIGDIKRFPNYKKLVSWAGLAPSMHQSGSVEYYGSITKQGSKMIRWIMVESARVAVNHDPRLKSFYERIKYRRGDQKAIVATASKMLKIIWTMLSRREPYESRNEKSYEKKLNLIDE